MHDTVCPPCVRVPNPGVWGVAKPAKQMSAEEPGTWYGVTSSEALPLSATSELRIDDGYTADSQVVLYLGDCLELLAGLPDGLVQLVVTSPPYNMGKAYETRRHLDDYLEEQKAVIAECVRVLSDTGSICWQVGNHVRNGEIWPLDTLLFPAFA